MFVNHNFLFTSEVRLTFKYYGGETFTFQGDDDVWVFINDQLAVDIGGVHGEVSRSVNLDSLGLSVGGIYEMDIFHAERCARLSNLLSALTACEHTILYTGTRRSRTSA